MVTTLTNTSLMLYFYLTIEMKRMLRKLCLVLSCLLKIEVIHVNTVKLVYNSHPWELKKWPLFKDKGKLFTVYSYKNDKIKMISVLKNWGWSWPLQAGGLCLELVVIKGLILPKLVFSNFILTYHSWCSFFFSMNYLISWTNSALTTLHPYEER